MGIADRPLLDLFHKLRSWISGAVLADSSMSGAGDRAVCSDCRGGVPGVGNAHHCRSCGRLFCRKCMRSAAGDQAAQPTLCKFCFRAIVGHADSVGSSPKALHCSTCRSYEDDEGEELGRHFFGPMGEVSHDNSDVDASSVSTGHEFYSFKSSPLDSPGRAGEHSDSSPSLDQEVSHYLTRPGVETEDHLENTSDCSYDSVAVYHNHDSQKANQPLDFENNSLLWYPPLPEDEEDDVESGFFGYDDEDDDVGDSSMAFSSASFSSEALPAKEKHNDANKEHLRRSVNGHFKALVSQLLKGEGLNVGSENGLDGWLDIVSSLSWQAANFVKPDTSRGGSMDPGDYLKVKCIPSGSPSDSTLVKGVVCTKNLKHKRMVSQHKNPRLLLLGGALEYQRVPDKLASINTVLEQEINHLKMAVSKIEARRPNVLLVEKSVPSYAQEYLLAKEISLVLNVKKTLLERISRCTGAQISPSIDGLAAARLGQCEMFRIEKVSEDCSPESYPSKKSTKTLMFFEGCPRRLGCTVLLKGAYCEELKKVKHVVQYATFAAYHLSLESSFLVDEGASLPKIPMSPMPTQEKMTSANTCNSTWSNTHQTSEDEHLKVESCGKLGIRCSSPRPEVSSVGESTTTRLEQEKCRPLSDHNNSRDVFGSHPADNRNGDRIVRPIPDFFFCGTEDTCSGSQCQDLGAPSQTGARVLEGKEKCSLALSAADDRNTIGTYDQNSDSPKYFSTADNHQSILVSLSSSCVLKGTVCERSQLFRIKFYGSFDKPLGRYLRDDLFDQSSYCRSCKEPAEAHVRCYTHQQGNLTINVRRLPSVKLPGERDGRIWMWHRCLKCECKDGVPPAARRVVMSDAAWGLSFGKFLELSFSNHTTANRIASCGHSLQRDCLRFYGFGNMVAFFRYSPVNILSIRLPPLVLDFAANVQEEWVKREAGVISNKMEFLHEEVSNVLLGIEQRITTSEYEPLKSSIHKHIWDLKDLLKSEKLEYEVLLQTAKPEKALPSQDAADILELNRLRRCLLIDSYTWDRRLTLLDSVSKTKCSIPVVDPLLPEVLTRSKIEEWRAEQFCRDGILGKLPAEMMDASTLSRISTNLLLSKQHEETGMQVLECNSNNLVEMDLSIESVEGYVGSAGFNLVSGQHYRWDRNQIGGEKCNDTPSSESSASPDTNLSDKIDLAWTGSGQTLISRSIGTAEADSVGSLSLMDNPSHKKLMSPVRVYSFDSALRFPNRRLSLSSHFSSIKSFNGPVDYVKNPIQNLRHSHNQRSLQATRSLNFQPSRMPMFITSTTHMVSEGARLLLPQPGFDNIVIAVYENDPTSIISYAISSQEHGNFIYEGSYENIKASNVANQLGHYKGVSNLAPREYISKSRDDHPSYSYGSEESQQLKVSFPIDPKESHFRISFEDGPSFPKDKVKFSVTCYFAKQFDALRKKCCPDEVDFIRSLSRCKRWNAQGGKSNVYFAKSLDGRFITKQVTKTELDSFEEFAPEYFKYLMESVNSGSPTCLAKVLGIYQVTIKYLKTGREVKMDLMVMENLFYRRNISRVYDLKGSSRARYNPDTSGNKVLLDLNLLETLRTKPIFLGSKAKRSLERAVWNDTSFLASIDVMDYSLLVGVDEERKELVIGIIDFMRQYTWDKHLETWVKASGILGGPRNAPPTVVSPKQYKIRFRKAMSSYFLTVPDMWST